jgi:hypothetical protein
VHARYHTNTCEPIQTKPNKCTLPNKANRENKIMCWVKLAGMKNDNALKNQDYTAMPLLFQPPGPLHAHNHRPMATQTLNVMAQKVGA